MSSTKGIARILMDAALGLLAGVPGPTLTQLMAHGPRLIATANIGCLTHLQSGTRLPVKHWIELLDARLAH